MSLFGSLEKDAQEAAAKVSAQFPGSSVTAEVNDKVVTLRGSAPDVATKGQIMSAFSALVPKAENVINVIHAERPGAQAAAPSSLPTPSAASTVPSGAPSIGGARTHTVVSGDTLSGIAKHYYGHANDYMKIFDANRDKLKDPDKIFPGQVLRIPD